MGHIVIDDPGAFAHIGEGSLVFAIHCSSSLYAKISEGVRPAIVVCNDIQKILFNEPQFQDVLEPLVQRCEEIAFPQLRTYFNDTVIYWRRSGDKAL
jgi:SRR1 protein